MLSILQHTAPPPPPSPSFPLLRCVIALNHLTVPAMGVSLTPALPPRLCTGTGNKIQRSGAQVPVWTSKGRTPAPVRTAAPVRTILAAPVCATEGYLYGGSGRKPCRSLVRPKAASGPPQGPGAGESTTTDSTEASSSGISPARDSAFQSSSSPGAAPSGTPKFPQDFFSDPGGARATRRLLLSAGGASALGLGANFLGVTSFLLSFDAELARRTRLDLLYPVLGFKRCLEPSRGFGKAVEGLGFKGPRI